MRLDGEMSGKPGLPASITSDGTCGSPAALAYVGQLSSWSAPVGQCQPWASVSQPFTTGPWVLAGQGYLLFVLFGVLHHLHNATSCTFPV